MQRTIAVLAVVSLGALLAVQAVAAGTFSISPAVVEHTAVPGEVGTVVVSNTTRNTLRVAVTPRPWIQAASGAVAANRRQTLAGVRVRAAAFTLTPGAQRTVHLQLTQRPAGGGLYGALEVVGTPPRAKKGLTAAFRLVNSIRLTPTPAQRRWVVATGKARVQRDGKSVTAILPVRNAGNTIDPVAGTVRISGPAKTRSVVIGDHRILPGHTVNLRLESVRGLPKGRYIATVDLRQHGHDVARVTRAFRVS